MLWYKSWCILINIRCLYYLMIVVFLWLLIRMEVLCVSERVCIHWLCKIEACVPSSLGLFAAGGLFRWRWSITLDTTAQCFGMITNGLQSSWLLSRTFWYFLFYLNINCGFFLFISSSLSRSFQWPPFVCLWSCRPYFYLLLLSITLK